MSVSYRPPSTVRGEKREAKVSAAQGITGERRKPEAAVAAEPLLLRSPLALALSRQEFSHCIVLAQLPNSCAQPGKLLSSRIPLHLPGAALPNSLLGRSPPPPFLPPRSCCSLNPPS